MDLLINRIKLFVRMLNPYGEREREKEKYQKIILSLKISKRIDKQSIPVESIIH